MSQIPGHIIKMPHRSSPFAKRFGVSSHEHGHYTHLSMQSVDGRHIWQLCVSVCVCWRRRKFRPDIRIYTHSKALCMHEFFAPLRHIVAFIITWAWINICHRIAKRGRARAKDRERTQYRFRIWSHRTRSGCIYRIHATLLDHMPTHTHLGKTNGCQRANSNNMKYSRHCCLSISESLKNELIISLRMRKKMRRLHVSDFCLKHAMRSQGMINITLWGNHPPPIQLFFPPNHSLIDRISVRNCLQTSSPTSSSFVPNCDHRHLLWFLFCRVYR